MTRDEIEILRASSRRCEAALDAAIASLHVGQQIADVELAYRRKMGELGGNTRWLIINQDGLNSGRNAANARALQAAYRAIRPGMAFDEVTKITADVMRQEGYNGFAGPHNVGLDHTDQPNSHANPVRPSGPLKFSEGSVFTVDVPYLEIGYGSSHVEDMMVCTKDGAVPLSSGDVSLRVRKA